VKPFPKVRELFEKLRDEGKRVALGSSGNSDDVTHYVELAKIGELFESQTTKSDVDESKPRPDVFLAALTCSARRGRDDRGGRHALRRAGGEESFAADDRLALRRIPEDELRAFGAIAIYDDPADLLESYQRSPLA
jgi:hypothetical protein